MLLERGVAKVQGNATRGAIHHHARHEVVRLQVAPNDALLVQAQLASALADALEGLVPARAERISWVDSAAERASAGRALGRSFFFTVIGVALAGVPRNAPQRSNGRTHWPVAAAGSSLPRKDAYDAVFNIQ